MRNRILAKPKNKFDPNMRTDKLALDIISEMAAKLKPHYKLNTLQEFLDSKKGKLRTNYEKHVREIAESGIVPSRACKVGIFNKVEDYGDESLSKDPRPIANRDTKFSLGYQRFTVGLEHAMQFLPSIMKGRDARQRGIAFQQRILSLGGKYLKTDFSRFDSTQHFELLRMVECGIMQHILSPEDYLEFESYWYFKMWKHGETKNGFKYELFGCRGSGDMDTGLFNTLLNHFLCTYFCRTNGFEEKFIVDGDDGVIWVPNSDFTNTFDQFGVQIDIQICADYHDVDFCSSKFLQINKKGDFMQVQNLPRVLGKIGTLKSKQFNHCAGEYYYSLGYMYSKIYPDFPIFRELSKFLMRITQRERKAFSPSLLAQNPHHLTYMLNSPIDIDHDFLLTEYMLSFGLGPAQLDQMATTLLTAKVLLPDCMDRRFRTNGRAVDRVPHHIVISVEMELRTAFSDYRTKLPKRLFELVEWVNECWPD